MQTKFHSNFILLAVQMQLFKFPKTVSSIEEYAFAYAKNLQHLELPNHLTNIGESAFTFSKITKLTALADGLSIGKKAFSNCAELETAEFKGAVSGIEEGAFQMIESFQL